MESRKCISKKYIYSMITKKNNIRNIKNVIQILYTCRTQTQIGRTIRFWMFKHPSPLLRPSLPSMGLPRPPSIHLHSLPSDHSSQPSTQLVIWEAAQSTGWHRYGCLPTPRFIAPIEFIFWPLEFGDGEGLPLGGGDKCITLAVESNTREERQVKICRKDSKEVGE